MREKEPTNEPPRQEGAPGAEKAGGPDARRWGWSLLFIPVLLAMWSAAEPPPPRPAEVAATEFSEARARRIIEHLTERIGYRVLGTEGHARAANYLEEQLRGITGLEVEIQDVETTTVFRRATYDFRLRNVLARLKGRSPEAILLSAHYDSPRESVGAADDAAGVAVMLEIARLLAAGEPLDRTIIFNFNGGEEAGLLGSVAFLEHPWMREVRAFINLEAAGVGGRALLFQTSDARLVRAYARAVPEPWGTAVAQDLFQSGLVPSSTDYEVYHGRGKLPGLDIALYEDGYAYHTVLDRVDRLEPGSVQHMGDTSLALVRELTKIPLDSAAPPAGYYDLLGRWMVVISPAMSRALTGGVLLLALAVLAVLSRRRQIGAGTFVAALVYAPAKLLLGVLAALLGGLLLPAIGRPHGWYAHPALAAVSFGALALAGALAADAFLARRTRVQQEQGWWVAALGSLLLWGLVLLAMSAAGLGTTYLALWGTGMALVGLVLGLWGPRRFSGSDWLAVLPVLAVVAQVATSLLAFFIPVAGRFGLSLPFDPVVAVLVALPCSAIAVSAGPAVQRAGRAGQVALVLVLLGLGGLVLTAMTPPYTPERPKRIWAEKLHDGAGRYWRLSDDDFPSLQAALGTLSCPLLAEPLSAEETCQTPPEAAPAPDPGVLVLSQSQDEAAGTRSITLRVAPAASYRMELRVPHERLVGWRVGSSSAVPSRSRVLVVVPPSAVGWEGTVEVKGTEPVPLSIERFYLPGEQEQRDIDALLPDWATAALLVIEAATVSL